MSHFHPLKISNIRIALSANRALLGEIRPNMRKIFFNYTEEKNNVVFYFYYDSEPTQEERDYDVEGTITTEICSDFIEDVIWEEKSIVALPPQIIHNLGICIFSRYDNFSCSEDQFILSTFFNTLLLKQVSHEGIDTVQIKLVAIFALLGEIRSNMRRISINHCKESMSTTLYIIYDDLSSIDECAGEIIVNKMKRFFPHDLKWKIESKNMANNEILPNIGICIYSRYEITT